MQAQEERMTKKSLRTPFEETHSSHQKRTWGEVIVEAMYLESGSWHQLIKK